MVDFSNFRSWVESQPPESTYDYTATGGCALAVFLKSEYGVRHVIVQPTTVHVDGKVYDLPLELDNAVSGRRAGARQFNRDGDLSHKSGWQTFGDLAKRLKKLEVA